MGTFAPGPAGYAFLDPPSPAKGEPVGDKTDRAKGQMKEKVGRTTGNASMTEKGRAEQSKGQLKKSGKALKNAVKKSP